MTDIVKSTEVRPRTLMLTAVLLGPLPAALILIFSDVTSNTTSAKDILVWLAEAYVAGLIPALFAGYLYLEVHYKVTAGWKRIGLGTAIGFFGAWFIGLVADLIYGGQGIPYFKSPYNWIWTMLICFGIPGFLGGALSSAFLVLLSKRRLTKIE